MNHIFLTLKAICSHSSLTDKIADDSLSQRIVIFKVVGFDVFKYRKKCKWFDLQCDDIKIGHSRDTAVAVNVFVFHKEQVGDIKVLNNVLSF